MPGFLGKIGHIRDEFLFNPNKNNKLINDKIFVDDIYLERRTVNKFINDKVFKENADYLILTEGVILNSNDLIAKYKEETLFDTIISMYKKNGNDFFNEFRGSFSGFFYDKKNNRKIIYTNHIGDKQIFYSQIGNDIIFGSEINYLVDYYKKNNLSYSLNKDAAYYLLTFGFLLEDNTLFNEIKKLIAGHYILVENNEMKILQYYKLDNTPDYNQSEEEIIENINSLFRQAVYRAFEKDKEYGYKHLVGLSGGLDSRMTTWVANNMGYGNNIVNFTFSQSDYLDETVAKKIASDLKHEWIFKSLDNGIFLKNVDDVVRISSGSALYYGLAHGKSCLDLLNKEMFGIVHTGQLGDVIVGTFYSRKDPNLKHTLKSGAYSNLLYHKLDEKKLKYDYANEEIFKFYSRGFNGANQGLLIFQEFGESYSPFYDIDFFNYCLKIPLEFRFAHNIYFKWILKKYNDASNYIWEKTKGKISNKHVTILGHKILVKQLPAKLLDYFFRKLNIKKSPLDSKYHMNPLDYWYNTNIDLKQFIDNYYYSNIDRLNNIDTELKKDCEYLFNIGTSIEKNQVITLLSFIKLYFGD